MALLLGCLGTLPAPAAAAADPIKAIVWENAGRSPFETSTIWTAQPDGGNAHSLVRGEDPDLSPDGRWVAYTVDSGAPQGIFLIPIEGGSPRAVFAPATLQDRTNDYVYSWAPDSTRIAFGVDGDDRLVSSYDITTAQRGAAVTTLKPDLIEFVPGGNQAVVASRESRSSPSDLTAIDLSTGATRSVANVGRRSIDSLEASSTELAFQASAQPASAAALNSLKRLVSLNETRVVNLSTGVQRLIATSVTPVGWGPNGDTLALQRANCSRSRCIYSTGSFSSTANTIAPGRPLGSISAKVRRSVRRGSNRRVRLTISLLTGLEASSDGGAFVGEKVVAKGSGPNMFGALVSVIVKAALLQSTEIVSFPAAGGPPLRIGRGLDPDWNL